MRAAFYTELACLLIELLAGSPPRPRFSGAQPPRLPEEMSSVEERELLVDSPLRARSLLTVRAAISPERRSETPRLRSLSLMCSY